MHSIYNSFFLLILGYLFYFVSAENIIDDQMKWPTVLVTVLARNKAHTLPYFLSLLTKLDYPKDRISLWIRSDHNQDKSVDLLKTWFNEVQNSYHSIDLQMNEDGPSKQPGEIGPTHWPQSRFDHVISLREGGLNYARNIWADFLLMIDADTFLVDESSLKELVLKQLDVVAPMLKSDGLYSNFWYVWNHKKYYYERTEEYKPTLYRERLGCFKVPMIHSAVLVNLRRVSSDNLTYDPKKIRNYNGPKDDIIAFAVSANLSGIPLHVCNDKKYGYIMMPLEQKDSLEMDEQQLTNLKMESISDDLCIEADPIFRKYITYPTMDEIGLDKVYMINLKRRPDRREKMEKSFRELGLNATGINAVDGRELDDAALAKWGINFLPGYKDPYHDRPMTFGEIGCFLSHYVIWKDVVDNGLGKVMILEDDIRFEPYFRRKLEIVLEDVEHHKIEWDLIYLGRKRLQEVDEPTVSDALVRASYSYWTLGYLLSQAGANKLLRAQPLLKLLPVDEYLPIMFNKHPKSAWSKYFEQRDLVALSASPLLIYPTHYTGEQGYVSDTEDSARAPVPSYRDDL